MRSKSLKVCTSFSKIHHCPKECPYVKSQTPTIFVYGRYITCYRCYSMAIADLPMWESCASVEDATNTH